LLPHIVWQNLHPLLEGESDAFVRLVARTDLATSPDLAALLPRAIERILARRDPGPAPIVSLFRLLAEGEGGRAGAAGRVMQALAGKVQTGELAGGRLAALRDALRPVLETILRSPPGRPLQLEAALLATSWKDPQAYAAARQVFQD